MLAIFYSMGLLLCFPFGIVFSTSSSISQEFLLTFPERAQLLLDQMQVFYEIQLAILQNKLQEKVSLRNKLEADLKDRLKGTTRAISMPKTCRDLNGIGHTLRGFYLVQSSSGNKVQVIYCDFDEGQPNDWETGIGYVDIKSFTTHFYVQKDTPYYQTPDSTIPFTIGQLNEGGAMEIPAGIFTAPINGTYHFAFSGVKEFSKLNPPLHLQLLRDNNPVSEAYAGNAEDGMFTLSLNSVLRLSVNDRVLLFLKGEGNLVDNTRDLNSHFTGSLLEHDLSMA